MCERIEGEEAWATEGVVRREDTLHVLALVLQLGRHLLDAVARNLRMRLEKLRQDAGARPMETHDEDTLARRGRRGHQDSLVRLALGVNARLAVARAADGGRDRRSGGSDSASRGT